MSNELTVEKLKDLLRECLPYVLSSAEASRMMDGFYPQVHKEDLLADRMFDAIGDEVLREALQPKVVRAFKQSQAKG